MGLQGMTQPPCPSTRLVNYTIRNVVQTKYDAGRGIVGTFALPYGTLNFNYLVTICIILHKSSLTSPETKSDIVLDSSFTRIQDQFESGR